MAAPIGPGDLLEVSEAHTPDMRASVRVSESGAVTLTLAGEVHIGGMDETAAAHAIETALIDRGMLLHPQVTVLVTAYAGQDVSVLGEVARPGNIQLHGASSPARSDFVGIGSGPQCRPSRHHHASRRSEDDSAGGVGSGRNGHDFGSQPGVAARATRSR